MSKKEWTTIDKSEWDRGPWDDEPDKVQWVDEVAGLDCLIVRNRGGALCGYVGVPGGHPLFGVGYSTEVEVLGAALESRKERPVGENPGMAVMLAMLGGEIKASPETVFEVHGGLTFADGCHEPTEEQFASIADRKAARLAEAAKYPQGDAARDVRELTEQEAMTFAEWRDHQMGRRICHVPAEGRPGRVWWFGFDCAHSGDLSPAHEAPMRRYGDRMSFSDETYRGRAYVEREVGNLAHQLAAITTAAAASHTKETGE